MSEALRPLDYSEFPDAIAPRRFEVINMAVGKDAVYGHGVELHSGMVIIETSWKGIQIYPSIKNIPLYYRWLDPPFDREEQEE